MNLMLDTHTLIWFLEGDLSLSERARRLIEDDRNKKYISIASLWEISIKISLQKLFLKDSLNYFLESLMQTDIEILQINLSHITRISRLEFFHKDPFDRLIISQCLEEGFQIVTRDPHFPLYEVDLYW